MHHHKQQILPRPNEKRFFSIFWDFFFAHGQCTLHVLWFGKLTLNLLTQVNGRSSFRSIYLYCSLCLCSVRRCARVSILYPLLVIAVFFFYFSSDHHRCRPFFSSVLLRLFLPLAPSYSLYRLKVAHCSRR